DVERRVTVTEVVDAGFDRVLLGERRRLADDVDHATGPAAAIEDGGGTAQDVDALDAGDRKLPGRETEIGVELQAIDEQPDVLGIESPDLEPVVARISAGGFGTDPGQIAQRGGNADRVLVADLVVSDHGYRLRGLHQRRVG